MNVKKLLESWKKYRLRSRAKQISQAVENPELFADTFTGNKRVDRLSLRDIRLGDKRDLEMQKNPIISFPMHDYHNDLGNIAFMNDLRKREIRGTKFLDPSSKEGISASVLKSRGGTAFRQERRNRFAQHAPQPSDLKRMLRVLNNRLSKKK